MINSDRTPPICSKVLLFGEYLVVQNGKALAITFPYFSGRLRYTKQVGAYKENSLTDFGGYLSSSQILSKFMDTELLKKDIKNGLTFESNIPTGHGVGSSGALCAAIFKAYRTVEADESLDDWGLLKDILSLMEAYFHGLSSGLDPLVSYIGKPLEINNRNEFSILENYKFKLLENLYLIGTGIERKTAPLVHLFLEQCKNEEFSKVVAQMHLFNESAIEAFKNSDEENFLKSYEQISRLQYEWFFNMIPSQTREFWKNGIDTGNYLVKLCGAGGGGFLLVYSKSPELIEEFDLINLN